MKVRIKLHSEFIRRAKRYRKKYCSFDNDYLSLIESLEAAPFQGDDLGGGIRKVRMSIAAKGKGKRGGLRVITFYAAICNAGDDIVLTLLTLYDKSEMESVRDSYIDWLIQTMDEE